ncbi:4-oxalocrotonate tautomerase [Effusibacillus dendaii]|uniref:Tautomerase n=1 Tax=Effusibacillus dendaii TaxID=2743772 RepID=A0A7I8DE59_9BACL|nr:4-oxalocrotonate tautomerase [Effusibacillus dendaii]BCJ88394.1 hypothetical protein skT53_33790 [Effusibacillus dendaii]
MPFVQIQMLEGRPEEKIKQMIRDVTDTIVNTLDVPKENVRVVVSEVPKTHWGIAGTPVSDIPGR